MPHHLRYQSTPWATHHVVSRCIQGFAFLTPHDHIADICRGVLGYSLHVHRETIKLHHYAFLSNHFHLLLSSATTPDLARFMCHFKGNLARELGRVHDWHDSFWQKRYSSEEILDEEGLTEIFKYITQNSVKEGLVEHPSQWAGLHGYHQLVEGREVSGPWVNRSDLYIARKRDKSLQESEFTKFFPVLLSPPPMWAEMSDSRYREHCEKLCEEAILEAVSARSAGAIGMARVLRQNVYQPRFTKRSDRPLCRTKCVDRMKAYRALYYTFKAQFQEASAVLREGIHRGVELLSVRFPAGGVPLFGGYVAPL